MLQNEKILITGPAGQVGLPLATHLAGGNDVWGVARFSEPGSRERLEAAGVTTRVVDLAGGDLSGVPDDFTLVVHLATFQLGGLDYDQALRTNAEGTGFLLQRCRAARAALVVSTASVYAPKPDPWHPFRESDPLGDAHQPHSPTYSISKIAGEAVARYCARAFDLPVTIARLNASYGPNGGLPAYHLDWIAGGQTVVLRAPGPTPYCPLSQDDINDQVPRLLEAAAVPATIVNWAGDEVVTTEEWCAHLGTLAGVEPRIEHREYAGSITGSVMDNTRRLELIGPCRVGWRDGMRRMAEARHPGLFGASRRAEALDARATRLLGAFGGTDGADRTDG